MAFEYISISMPIRCFQFIKNLITLRYCLVTMFILGISILSYLKLSCNLTLSVSSTSLFVGYATQNYSHLFLQTAVGFELYIISSRISLKFLVIGGQRGIQLRCLHHGCIGFLILTYLCFFFLSRFLKCNNSLTHTLNHSIILIY